MIYLDQAATSFPKIKEVQDAVIDCMNHCTNANRSTSATSLNASRLIYQTRKLIKEYFHVPQDGCVVLNSGNTENVEETTNETSGINNGFTIKIEKITSDMSTKINAEIGVVTNLEINTKLSLALTTTGTTNSKDIKNQAIITFTTQEGQLIATLNYNANFEKATTAIEDLTNENCLFLDKLNTEEFNNITKQITDRIETVINEKKVVLNLIDQNNNTSIIEQGNTNNTVAKDDARQKLIDVVTGMMAEVQNRGEVFTLNNLVGLQIEGYNVSCSVNGNIATIVVNGYTFYIDSDFNLTEE